MTKSSLLLHGLAAICAAGITTLAVAKDSEKAKPKPNTVEVEGTGDEDPEDTSDTLNEVEPELAVVQNGQKVKHSCKDGAPLRVNIIGNNNQVTVDGECKSLIVTGNGNKVTIEAVGEITALGDSLDISYKRGLGGKEPQISKVGDKVKIVKIKK